MSTQSDKTLRSKLLGLMVLRVVFAIAFLVVATWFQISDGSYVRPSFFPLHTVVAAIGLLSVVYASILNKFRNLALFANLQILIDIALITVIVYVTGGIDSYLFVLYPLIVMGASSLVGKRGGYLAASFSSIGYGLLMTLDFYNILPESYKVLSATVDPAWEDVLTSIATNMLAFFVVAYLAGHLVEKAERVEKELEDKEIDFGRLEELNRVVVDNISSGIMTVDENDRVTSFNNAATAITGYSLREVYYQDIGEVFKKFADSERWRDGSGYNDEVEMNSKDGKVIQVGYTVSTVQSKDVDRIVIFQDLTGIKAMEEQLRRDEKLKGLGELAASIAHEIRNPLASISGSIQVLKKDLDLEGDSRHLMEIVVRETERLNALITDFLLFAKPAKGNRDPINVKDVIEEALRVFSHSPEAMGLDVRNNVRDDIIVLADRRQMSQVFWNLFVNAASAMPDGGILTVEAKSGRVEDFMITSDEDLPGSSGVVIITVSDTGGGIAAEDLQRIFDPFYSTRESGTGLGLSLVHRMIESHGGSIEVTSTIGKGTVFNVSLPLTDLEERA
ncbi:MAG: PAS domain S-box protein [Deltaproteobacteria bacterium]|nr:PAS domain S-box protein [Deltaproteobacteria bacterium]